VRSLRSLIVEIYPPNLYDEGLHAALSDLTASVVPPSIWTTLDIEVPLPPLDAPRTELAYRVAQEGLRNAVQHARPKSITVDLGRRGDLLVLRVVDDGAGCDPDRLAVRPGHLGLRALGEMAAGHGAALLIESAPGHGTVLRLEVPL
jgi:two-component system, NarL family, sensor kinase